MKDLKKMIPVAGFLLVLLIAIVSITVGKNNKKRNPILENENETYVTFKEEVGGNTFNYSYTYGDLYNKLKGSVGLSSLINTVNKQLLQTEIFNGTTSYYDAIEESEIKAAIDEACFGKDVDVESLTQEEKIEKQDAYLDTMFSSGYDADSIYGDEIKAYHRLSLAKKLYAKTKLNKEIKDNNDYFDTDKIDEYYENNYNKSYWAIILPFASSEQATIALNQLGITNESGWKNFTLTEKEVNGIKNGQYTKTTNKYLSTYDVVNSFIKIYNTINAQYGKSLVEGTYTLETDANGNKTYKFNDTTCDYIVVSFETEVEEASNAINTLKEAVKDYEDNKSGGKYSEVELAEKKANLYTKEGDTETGLIVTALAKANSVQDATGEDDNVKKLISDLKELQKFYDGSDTTGLSSSPTTLITDLVDTFALVNSKAIVFNTDKENSDLYWNYNDLYAYDSNLPAKFNGTYQTYVPYNNGDKKASVNESSAMWYSTNSFSSNSVYYYVIEIMEVKAPAKSDVLDEIKGILEEEALTDDFVETKLCELRKDNGFVVYDKDIQDEYIEHADKYKVDYKKYKKAVKKNSDVVCELNNGFKVTTTDLFNAMDKSLGLATIISELSYERLLNNTMYNKYYDASSNKWIGDDGKELRKNIISNIETQRINFLGGAYAQYGYDPSTMSWEDFMVQLNGANNESELAKLSLYSSVSNDYISDVIDFIQTKGEGKDIEYKMNDADAANSKIWKLVEKRMKDMVTDKFTVKGVHLLVSMYETINDSCNSGTPINPTKWTNEQKELAKTFINDVKKYLEYAPGSYSTKLNNVATKFSNAPYSVKDTNGYVRVLDSSNEEIDYVLNYPGGSIDLSYYKTKGLYVKYEDLGEFSEGKMVKPFEEAAKSIWEQDKLDNVENRITVYNDSIETEFGYHLYVNLASTFTKTYKGNTDKDTTVDTIVPTLYEVRLAKLIEALEAYDTSSMNKEDKASFDKYVKEKKELLTDEAKAAVENYYNVVSAEIVGSYWNSLQQQYDIKRYCQSGNITLNSKNVTLTELVRVIDINAKSVCENNLEHLEVEDITEFDIPAYKLANKESK